MADGSWTLYIQDLQTTGGGPVPPPAITYIPVVTVLQVTNAIGGEIVPTVFVNDSIRVKLSVYDDVLQQAVQADSLSVVVTITAPDGTSSTSAVSNPGIGVYQANAQASQVGTYGIDVVGTTGGGTFKFVAEAQVNAVARFTQGAPAVDTWFFVRATQSPYAMVPSVPDIAVDLRQGIVSLTFWPLPADGDECTVSDWFGLSSQGSTGSGQPGGPIILAAAGGVTIEDPSNPGTFSATVHIASPQKFVGTWRYSMQQNQWGFASYAAS